MKLPVGKISGEALDKLFSDSIKYHISTFLGIIAEYEPIDLFSNWRTLIRSIDEIINIPGELNSQKDSRKFLSLGFDFTKQSTQNEFGEIINLLKQQFDDSVATRFTQIALMSSVINKVYEEKGLYYRQGSGLNLATTINSIGYFQSRRLYYLSALHLIPKISNGKRKCTYLDLLNVFQYYIDSCMVNITTSYYNLLLNQCLPDFEMMSDGTIAKGNFSFDHLEGFFTDPERLSLLDQMELRPEIVAPKDMLAKSDKKLFSFSEVANAMSLFAGAFVKYELDNTPQFKEMGMFFVDIAGFILDDFNVIIDEESFTNISEKYKRLLLSINTDDYFIALNSSAPFQKLGTFYFSTVVLLTRFVYRTMSVSLLKNKTFQIHSGFVFEDKVSKILSDFGFKLTGITRINHKEFDLITIKNEMIYNFQCKNNFIDISRVDYNYKLIGKFNRLLCKYYERALIKEEKREELIIEKTGINKIEHFVISRYPVISRNKNIINFNGLEKWIKANC